MGPTLNPRDLLGADELTATAALFAAGLMAGFVNTVAGAGTLIVYPVLLFLGYPPITANVSAAVGVLPGSISGAFGGRSHLAVTWRKAFVPLVSVCAGSITGSTCLLVLDPEVFTTLAPGLIVAASLLVVVEPMIRLRLKASRPQQPRTSILAGLLFAAGFYGGYFGAAQGIVLIAVLTTALPWALTRLNAVKNVLGAVSNGVAVLLFVTLSHTVAWLPAISIAAGATIGGLLGARIAPRLPVAVFRAIIMVLGLVAAATLLRT